MSRKTPRPIPPQPFSDPLFHYYRTRPSPLRTVVNSCGFPVPSPSRAEEFSVGAPSTSNAGSRPVSLQDRIDRSSSAASLPPPGVQSSWTGFGSLASLQERKLDTEQPNPCNNETRLLPTGYEGGIDNSFAEPYVDRADLHGESEVVQHNSFTDETRLLPTLCRADMGDSFVKPQVDQDNLRDAMSSPIAQPSTNSNDITQSQREKPLTDPNDISPSLPRSTFKVKPRQGFKKLFSKRKNNVQEEKKRIVPDGSMAIDFMTNQAMTHRAERQFIVGLKDCVSAAYGRSTASIAVQVTHGVIFAAERFHLSYILTIRALPEDLETSTASEAVNLIVDFVHKEISNPPDRGVINIASIPRGNSFWDMIIAGSRGQEQEIVRNFSDVTLGTLKDPEPEIEVPKHSTRKKVMKGLRSLKETAFQPRVSRRVESRRKPFLQSFFEAFNFEGLVG
ncbi:Fc.00g076380.m01.CDS01 [Cosmosporella sp. VM-42]